MAQKETLFTLLDNSGAQYCKVIQVYRTKYLAEGQTFRASIKKIKPYMASTTKIKKGEITEAITVRTKRKIRNTRGFIFAYSDNSCICLKRKGVREKLHGLMPLKFVMNYNKKLPLDFLGA